MNKSIAMSLTILCALFAAQTLISQDAPSAEEMQKWTAYATPSEGHKFLEQFVGHWTAELTMWPAAGAPAVKSNGESEGRMILGGRYLEQRYKGEYMGMPFEGRNLMAFDNHHKRIESIWLDSMGTGFLHGIGTLDPSMKVSTEHAETVDIISGQAIKSRTVTTVASPDKIVMDMYWQKEGEAEFKTMEIVYSRKK